MKYCKSTLILLAGMLLMSSCKRKKERIYGEILDNAVVVAAHPVATKVGLDIQKKGGNAYDAAIAVQFALAVVYPRAGNIGGGGFVVWRQADGSAGTLDFREKAPIASTKDMYLDEDGNVIEDLSIKGHKAAGVPGTVDGMYRLHEKFGSIPWSELIQPAIDLAQNGVKVSETEAKNYNRFQDDINKYNEEDNIFLKTGGWKTNDTLIQKDLAKTLILVRDSGRNGFYSGRIAELIIDEMDDGGGIITIEDLQQYASKFRNPVEGDYKGHKIIAMPPPSSGGVAVIQLLKGAENYDLSAMGHNSAETIHILTELERRVFADRATHLGDMDHYDVPLDMLLSDQYNDQRFSAIKANQKTSSQDIKEGEVEIIESIETTHFSIVDESGNAVAVTTTLNSYFGCKVMVSGAGFFLNNEMDDFSVKLGAPNQFGLVGSEANAIIPSKRMLSSMTPTIVEKNNDLYMVLGTPGGSTIITSVFQTILNVIDFEMTMQEAVNANKTHHQWLPDRIIFEKGGLSDGVIKELRDIGHKLEERSSIGRLNCIMVRPDGKLEGAPDYLRGDCEALGY